MKFTRIQRNQMYHKYFFSENTTSNIQHTAEQYKRKQNNFNMTTIPSSVPSSYLTPVCPVCLSTLKCKHSLHYLLKACHTDTYVMASLQFNWGQAVFPLIASECSAKSV